MIMCTLFIWCLLIDFVDHVCFFAFDLDAASRRWLDHIMDFLDFLCLGLEVVFEWIAFIIDLWRDRH